MQSLNILLSTIQDFKFGEKKANWFNAPLTVYTLGSMQGTRIENGFQLY